jgi:hypothetical protein
MYLQIVSYAIAARILQANGCWTIEFARIGKRTVQAMAAKACSKFRAEGDELRGQRHLSSGTTGRRSVSLTRFRRPAICCMLVNTHVAAALTPGSISHGIA